ncbi:S8 family serine peptidase [Alkalihalobacterium alkalinitrilicum]|uniref:S8 family serine peptidase n=1 Tax=Alkalihalobacterium alkalinitrilicum TaxID=427920 RepID=UPI0009949882|nr:S8 family serine peptidase [Alkalihalobacterium alkalinitrilicum]
MKKLLSILIVFLFIFQLVPHVDAQSDEEIIILFKDKIDLDIIGQVKGKVEHEFENIPAVAITVSEEMKEALENNPNVLAIESDQVIQIQSQAQVQDWGIKRINAPNAWEAGYTGKGVKIAVIDTGIAPHNDLKIAGGASFTPYTTSYVDDNGHGTHIAGIIGARNNGFGTVGVAHEAELYAVKVLGKDGSGLLSSIVAGIDWAITNNMDIINLSLGAEIESPSLKEAVDRAYNNGILVVAAAGNNGSTNGVGDTVNFPARYDSAIAVSATNKSDQRATFSATGNAVELAAPGVEIYSTHLKNGYAHMSGTSMATPYVSGNLALLKEAYPNLSPAQIREKLQKNVIDLGANGRDPWFGFGLIQAPQIVENDPNEPGDGEEPKDPDPVQPVDPVEPPKPPEQPIFTIQLTENTYLFDHINGKRRIEFLRPQRVSVFEEVNDWYRINTWIGPKWIKPNNPLLGEPTSTSARITITENTYLHNHPWSSARRSEFLRPQTVTAIEEWGEWYRINTWIGPKWIKPNNPLLGQPTPISTRITITENTYLHNHPWNSAKRNEFLRPQTVTAFEEWNGWYRINTWLGPMWIQPNRPLIGEPNPISLKLTLTENTFLHNQPWNSARRTEFLRPQAVTAFEEWNGWYRINTWIGPKWIKPNDPLKGDPTNVTISIHLIENTYLHDQPWNSARRNEFLRPQTVTAVQEWDGWYRINTWIGPKWIQPSKVSINNQD